MEDRLERRQVDDRGGDHDLEQDPPEQQRVRGEADSRRDARSVREAIAVPIWHATIPANVIAVAVT